MSYVSPMTRSPRGSVDRLEKEHLIPTKACPVVLRRAGTLDVLAFEHPLAGFQLVKGSIERGESPAAAAARELLEESGVQASSMGADLGIWVPEYQGQVWSFHVCQVSNPLPEHWVHHAADDGGHDFRFFWQPLSQPVLDGWHRVFRGALLFIAERVLTKRC
ncbi:NUDIX hydrolase [Variovorax boronicumulans]|uniref:NUDIX hydrolase n=1 Tax=Variovorax boronicumulans TaxID=436515 RepID=UPI00278E49DC|nr:NUDIX domain-containing protein [Variovorax boronicumulans]MDP9877290.1 8-oxo-dGTP pyrophosphatase MutT (NUDIX family) [Variovorax boronicumulans]